MSESSSPRVETPALSLRQFWILLTVGQHRRRQRPVRLQEVDDECQFTTDDGYTWKEPVDTDLDFLGMPISAESKEVTPGSEGGYRKIVQNAGGVGMLRMAEDIRGRPIQNTVAVTPHGWRQLVYQKQRVVRDAERLAATNESEAQACTQNAAWRGGKSDPSGAEDFGKRAKMIRAMLKAVTGMYDSVMAIAPLTAEARGVLTHMAETGAATLKQQRVDDTPVGVSPDDIGSIELPISGGNDGVTEMMSKAEEAEAAPAAAAVNDEPPPRRKGRGG